jgi:AcrR family transcriptional regulator
MGKKRDQKRKEILRAALEEFCVQGIGKTPMSDIAQKSGISRRTLYTYYDNKDRLADDLYVENLNNLFSMIRDLEYVRHGAEEEAIAGTLRRYLDIRRTHPEYVYYDYIYNNYCAGRGINPNDSNVVSNAIAQWFVGIPENRETRIEKSPRFLSLHLFFCYLQKSVLRSVQQGDLNSTVEYPRDEEFLNFLLNGIGK